MATAIIDGDARKQRSHPAMENPIMERLIDKVALISGGARGIGAAVAARSMARGPGL